MNKRILLLLTLCIAHVVGFAQAFTTTIGIPKREFRGAWIQCVNGQFQGMSREAMQAELTRHLDALKRVNTNVVIFQVRPEFDALYRSTIEPWSRFLTGTQGKDPGWDPLEWIINESHARGMELHAWINPFRAKTKGTASLSLNHPYVLNPERFFAYGDLLIADPAIPENRNHIYAVVRDILTRYDVDGLHIDDYFYPYPEAGRAIPDDASFARYNNGIRDRADWRRYNVNTFIEQLHDEIHRTKPWVRFGVSPFGIYHNASASSPIPGSNTRGLQNYDDLYADILLWVNKGWIDYNVPQIYWEIGHATADYDTLIKWWAANAANRPLVIGQDIERTVRAADLNNPSVNQLPAKMQLQRGLPYVAGSTLWYSAALANNTGGYADALATAYQPHPALLPHMPFIDHKAPGKVSKLKAVWTADGYMLFWTAPKASDEMNKARWYAVYRFAQGERIDTDNPSHLIAITQDTHHPLPYADGSRKYTYVVTALDRTHNESKSKKRSVKL